MILKLFTTIIFLLLTIQSSFSNQQVLPLKKPEIGENSSKIKIENFSIIPKSKPQKKEEIVDKQELKLLNINVVKKINGIIVPKNKPLIVKKQTLSKIKKRRYFSDRDMNYAKQAMSFMEKSN